ncbi:hypothetical protein C8R44DRAFT_663896 [Mycena epipterygia]|nr:hypothetical protein C8R44DRAFT_663896 [Mycena epipterygia]
MSSWSRLMYWAFTITETSAILINHFTVNKSSDNVVAESHHFGSRITPTFLLGTGLLVAGATIRIRCFREMGRHFTFALSLRDGHRLITTGPYAVVRHPSYTGVIMVVLGKTLGLMYDGSWWFDGGHGTLWGRFLALNFLACSILQVRVCLRGGKEDAYLKKAFGEQWVQFAKKVPYMYIPGVW